MVSDFIEQQEGFLHVHVQPTEDRQEMEVVRAGTSIPKMACVLLEYGIEKEG